MLNELLLFCYEQNGLDDLLTAVRDSSGKKGFYQITSESQKRFKKDLVGIVHMGQV